MGLLGSIRKDIAWRLADPLSLVMWIGIPLVIGGTMGLVFGGQGIKAKAKLLITDQENSTITKFLTGASGGDLLEMTKVSLAEGDRRIRAGEASGHLLIPKGFDDALLGEAPATLRLVTNPSHRIWPQIFQDTLKIGVDGAFYLDRIAGDILRRTVKPFKEEAEPSLTDILATTTLTYQRSQTLQKLLDPVVLKVEDELTPAQEAAKQAEEAAEQHADVGAAAKPKPSFNIGLLLFPGILFMSLMFIAQGVTFDVWREKDLGTLARILCSPTGAVAFMLSKLLTGMLVMAAVAGVGLLLGYLTFGLPFAVLPGALLWITFAGSSLLALFFLLQMFASSSRGANVLTSVIVFPLMMIGGSFIPYGSMPDGLEAIGQFTPNGLAVAQLAAIVKGEVVTADLLAAAAQLLGVTLVFFFLSVRLVRTRLARS